MSNLTNFQFDYVEVVINNERVYYEPKTLLTNIGIRKDDICIALKKPYFQKAKERENYE